MHAMLYFRNLIWVAFFSQLPSCIRFINCTITQYDIRNIVRFMQMCGFTKLTNVSYYELPIIMCQQNEHSVS